MTATTTADPLLAPPAAPGRSSSLTSSIVVWLALVAYLAVAKVLSLTLIPITFRGAGQERLFDWTTLAVYAALGLVGVVLAARTGFPAASKEGLQIIKAVQEQPAGMVERNTDGAFVAKRFGSAPDAVDLGALMPGSVPLSEAAQ